MKAGVGQEEFEPAIPARMGRGVALTVVAMWTLHFLLITSLMLARDWDAELAAMPRRAVMHLIGIFVSVLIVAVHAATSDRRLWQRVCVTVLAAYAGAALHAATNPFVFALMAGEAARLSLRSILVGGLERMWFYTSLSATVLALTYSFALREQERRMAALAARAHAAQMNALRYQLNPHFLFNTLNAIAALVRRRQHRTAEGMIENLSDFLRGGLALAPDEDVPLADELKLQSLYLDIERQRFPGRLNVRVDVPEALGAALVPSLITQPLLENAVRGAVTRSAGDIHLTISARRDERMLHLAVAVNAAAGECARGAPGALDGVEARLRTRFGTDCGFHEGPDPAGGHVAGFSIPLRLARRMSALEPSSAGGERSGPRRRPLSGKAA